MDYDYKEVLIFCIFVISSILFLAVMIKSFYDMWDQDNKKREYMTLKTYCDVRDTNCLISCTTAKGEFIEKCYIECQRNSPFC